MIEERRYLRKITKIHCHLRNRYFVTAILCLMFCRSLFVILSFFLLAITVSVITVSAITVSVITASVILRFTACDNNLFCLFKLFFTHYDISIIKSHRLHRTLGMSKQANYNTLLNLVLVARGVFIALIDTSRSPFI